MLIEKIIKDLEFFSNEEYAKHHAGFFKTAKGEYGEGDLFLGLMVPDVRQVAKKYYLDVSLDELDELMKNPYHEVRLCALVMMVDKYKKVPTEEQAKFYDLYLRNVSYINNWDLVDISAPHVVGHYLFDKNSDKLFDLAQAQHLWSQRVSIIATLYFIRKQRFEETLKLAEIFLTHRHDLMHKASGWMLREVGKRDELALCGFLDKFHKVMPRTMLRYSIEKLSKEQKAYYMEK